MSAEKEKTLAEEYEESKKRAKDALRLKAGDFFELNTVCYEVVKVSHKGTLFCKPFAGSLLIKRGFATATQLKGARKA